MTGAPALDALPLGRWCAAAILVCEGRYLMQLRDDKPGLLLRAHWALFGGSLDPGEDAAAAMRRELAEELEFHPRKIEALTEMELVLPLAAGRRRDRLSFFLVPFTRADLAAMVLHEGAAKRLFTPAALARETRIAPWDLAAVLMHARRAALFEG